MEKQILAALEIADHEVRLLVGQFYNGRLNILKVERGAHMGVQGHTIVSENHVVEAIKKAVENASRNLGVVIRRVLLLVPSANMKHVNRQLRIPITGRISELDVRRAYREVLKYPSPDGYVLADILISKFFVNGSSTRKVPMNEKCDNLTLEAECYYIKESIAFPFIGCVEKSGLKVIDIILDDIGLAKEASLFEASIDTPIIGLALNEQSVHLALFHKGVYLSNEVIDNGFHRILGKLETSLKVPSDVVHRLLYYNVDLSLQEAGTDPIFMWSSKSNTYTITQADIMDLVADDVKDMLRDLSDRCEPIYTLGKPRYVITGVSSEILGIPEFMEQASECDAECYRSTTFGVKDAGLTSLLGAFYYYKDQQVYRDYTLSSVDEEEYKRVVLQYNQEVEEESITKKLKNMFFER
ncbi:MAG: cell division protein FtsA [Erysipelothrix sp.]